MVSLLSFSLFFSSAPQHTFVSFIHLFLPLSSFFCNQKIIRLAVHNITLYDSGVCLNDDDDAGIYCCVTCLFSLLCHTILFLSVFSLLFLLPRCLNICTILCQYRFRLSVYDTHMFKGMLGLVDRRKALE